MLTKEDHVEPRSSMRRRASSLEDMEMEDMTREDKVESIFEDRNEQFHFEPQTQHDEQKHERTMSFSLPEDLETEYVTATALYKDLAKRVIHLYDVNKDNLRNGQLFIAIAGGPGSGKSTLAYEVAKRINVRLKEGMAVALPMDGFHYSRAELKKMAEAEGAVYTYEELLKRRGAPWTFNAQACIAAFQEAREKGTAKLPIYDRSVSDPIPDGVSLELTHTIVLLEGNYLLAWDDPAWAPLKGIFDETWYISCTTLEEQRERLINRHLKTWTEEKMILWGEGRIGAERKADSNDVLNSAWIHETSRHHADMVLESK
ncbi:hypothetical protein FisN_22Hh096 [Fistulifera solaris]|uniref:Phosphoribulokinase/uridine kinase domain-containing protein n=1 Tax=Fistulifera solaris TaxID=1519565 RepID=A0A1Z5K7V2_FISSO|nr:hypothetical protein FisN_22Hh096 [Fistulifera solaris]|eukprot:GAX22304.1 hypothetical protein FisN_22Hh096 [Fistulifera solaris]